MALSPFYNTAEEIPESIKDIYKINSEGKFILDVETKDGYALEQVTGLKTALQSERNAAKALQEKVNNFESLNTQLNQKIEASASKTPVVNQDESKVVQLEAKMGEMQTLLNERDSQYNGLRLKQEISTAFSAYKEDLMPSADKILLPHLERNIKIIDNNVKVVDSLGQVRISMNGSTVSDMTVSELIGEYKNDKTYSTCFKGTNASGSGAMPNSGSLNTAKTFKDLSGTEKAALYKDNKALYNSMKDNG